MKITAKQYLALAKRSASFLEMLSVASFAVGIFQSQIAGFIVGIGTLAASVILICVTEK